MVQKFKIFLYKHKSLLQNSRKSIYLPLLYWESTLFGLPIKINAGSMGPNFSPKLDLWVQYLGTKLFCIYWYVFDKIRLLSTSVIKNHIVSYCLQWLHYYWFHRFHWTKVIIFCSQQRWDYDLALNPMDCNSLLKYSNQLIW